MEEEPVVGLFTSGELSVVMLLYGKFGKIDRLEVTHAVFHLVTFNG